MSASGERASPAVGERVRAPREPGEPPEPALIKSVREVDGEKFCNLRFEADGFYAIDVAYADIVALEKEYLQRDSGS